MTQTLIPAVGVARGAAPQTARTSESQQSAPESAEPKGQARSGDARESFRGVLSRKQNPRSGAEDAPPPTPAVEKQAEAQSGVRGDAAAESEPQPVEASTGDPIPVESHDIVASPESGDVVVIGAVDAAPDAAAVAPDGVAPPVRAEATHPQIRPQAARPVVPPQPGMPDPAATPRSPTANAESGVPTSLPEDGAVPPSTASESSEAVRVIPRVSKSPNTTAAEPAAAAPEAPVLKAEQPRVDPANESTWPVTPKPAAAPASPQPVVAAESAPRAADAPKRNTDSIFRIESAPPSSEPTYAPMAAAPRTAAVEGAEMAKPTLAPAAPQPDEAPPAPQIVARGLTAAVAQRGGTVHIRLVPESLGEVRIHMTLDAATVNVRIDASTASAQHLLTDHLGTLRASLESRGLQVDRIAVNLAPTQTAPASPPQQHSSADGGQTGGQPGHHNAADSQSRGRSDEDPRHAQRNPSTEPIDAQNAGNFQSRLRFRLSAVA